MEKIKIAKDSPSENRTEHLKPIINFLIDQGNIPTQKEFTFDKGGIGTFEFFGPIDSSQLKSRFEFPQSIHVGEDPHYGGGVVWDERNALKIHKGR